MDIKVLGTGCAKCKKLYEAVQKAVTNAGLPASVSKIEKLEEIMSYGVMMTPAVVVDGEVKSTGRVPDVTEIMTWITSAAAKP